MVRLNVFSGLPGTGKSSIARGVAEDARYRVVHSVARDNLRVGRHVVADCVNPWMLTRNAWRDVGICVGAEVFEIETTCADRTEHRRRIEGRAPEVPGFPLPDWAVVMGRDDHPWDRDHLTIDSAGIGVAADVERVVAAVQGGSQPAKRS